MSKVDRYMLSQLLWLFGFFALVLVALFWINRAVVLFDRLIGDGQSGLVFLEFTILTLPRSILNVVPIATFAASVYVAHRLISDSELTVLRASGASAWRLIRPVAVFGVIVAVIVAVLANVLVPAAQKQLAQREAEIARDVTARLLTEGRFLSPTTGVTFYTREIGADGILRDVFLADRRAGSARMIYSASEAYLVRDGARAMLIMVDGLAQRFETDGDRLTTAKFDDFSFDISSLVNRDRTDDTHITHMTTRELLASWTQIGADGQVSAGAKTEELHSRMARPLFSFSAAIIGFAVLIAAGFSRFGVWREILFALVLLIILDGLRGSVAAPVLRDESRWPLMYLPGGLGLVAAAILLWWPGRIRRRRA